MPTRSQAGFTVVVPDLRGYGASGKPATVDDHSTYGTRQWPSTPYA
ncbi:hypothetical protein [Actinoplanes solisilvae]|nr:hypothetical protein [Actinoplanes solisilvae]